MRLEFLLEEPSAEAALRVLVPRLRPDVPARYRPFEGCRDLLRQLPTLLRGYARRIGQAGETDLRIIVLLDADSHGPARKAELERHAAAAGLITKSSAAAGAAFSVLNRLAVQELEAWLLGDQAAIQAAYPRVRTHHFKGVPRDPDAIEKSASTLLHVLQQGGLFLAGKQKQKWAADIAMHMQGPERNTSRSFRCFCQGLAALR